MCNIYLWFLLIARAIYVLYYEADFHKPGIYGGSGRVWANTWDVFRRTPSREVVAVAAGCCGFRGGFWLRQDLVFFSFYFLRMHTACCKYKAALPHLPLY